MKSPTRTLISIMLFLLAQIAYTGFSQADSSGVLQPIPIDKTALSGIGLKKIDLQDQPGREFFQKNLYRGKALSVYVVSSQSWPGRMDNFAIDEFIYMYNGKARVKPDGGEDHFFVSGEYFFAPKGYTGEWEILAGDYYHYELSVITTPRADTVLLSKNLIPQLLDKDKISGIDIQLKEDEAYTANLVRGDELTIAINAELPGSQQLESSKEQVIGLLSGQLTVSGLDQQAFTFYSGDFFIIPAGFTGTWSSAGHGMVKYLSIQQTE